MVVMAVLVALLVKMLRMVVVMAAMVKVHTRYGKVVLDKEQPHVLLLKPMVRCFLMEAIVV